MKKRILALALSLSLAASLTAPAFAAQWEDTDYTSVYDYEDTNTYLQTQVDEYAAAHPGELEALSTETLLAWLGYTETLTPAQQLMKDWDLESEEEVRLNLLWDYVYDRQQVEEDAKQALTFRQTYPDRWADFDADAFFLEDFSVDSDYKEEFMRTHHLFTQEEFAQSMFVYYVNWYSWEWEDTDPGYNDEPYYPWYGKDRPIRLVVNGQSLYDAEVTEENWVTYADAATLNPILGTDYPAGQAVAIREAATAAGWDVVWNTRSRQVVLLDRQRLLPGNIYPQDLDIPTPDFSTLDGLMNRLLSDAAYDSEKAYQLTQTQQLTFTALNSLDGDKTVKATLKAQVTMKGTAMEAVYTLSCAQLLDLLSPQVQAQLEGSLPKFKLKDLKSLLTGSALTFRADLETGEVFFNAPILSLIDDSIPQDAWIHTQADFSQVLALLDMAENGSWDTKALLYDLLLSASAENWSAESAYRSFQSTYGLLTVLAGPSFLTEKNGVYTWTLNSDSLALLGSALRGYTAQDDLDLGQFFREFSFTLRVDKNARTTLDMAIRPDMDALGAYIAAENSYRSDPATTAFATWLMGLLDFKATAHAAGNSASMTEETSFHWKNQFKATLDSQTTRRTTNAVPNTLPPEGANIVEP